MTRQFMVRILREVQEEYADVVINADDEESAQDLVLNEVITHPEKWFDKAEFIYIVDPSMDIEDVSDCGYSSDIDE